MKPTEDRSIMHLEMVQELINKGARVNNIQMFRGDVVTEVTVFLKNLRKLNYSLSVYPINRQVVKITEDNGEVIEEKSFEHVHHVMKFIESKV